MKILPSIFLILMLGSCQLFERDSAKIKEDAVHRVKALTIAKLKDQYDLYAIGSGGCTMDQVKMLHLAFAYDKEVDLSSARNLIILSINEFMNTINNDDVIRPYLDSYPFNPKNIEIMICIMQPNGIDVDSNKIALISLHDGVIDYEACKSENALLTTIHKETYGEAIEKLQEGQNRAVMHYGVAL